MNILDVFEYNQHFVAMMNIINMARLNPPESGDKHHIIPRCWFTMNNLPIDNSDENLVLLNKEQHGKVHKLMSLCAKDEQLKRNMVIAAHLMGLPTTSLKYTPTDETRKKMSEAHKGLHLSEEHRRKISESKKGHTVTVETLRKMSEALSGNKNPMYRKKHSEISRIKMSEAKKGKKSWNKGIHMSDEAKKKLSETNKGKRKGMTWKLVDGHRVWYNKEIV